MKIYPNKANIIATKEINYNTDIPLSYINTDATDYNVNIIINEKFKTKQKREVLPYESLISNTMCLFDKNNNQISYDKLAQNLVREDDHYKYIPFGSTSFFPHKFKYNVIAKRNMPYSLKNVYNINLLIANDPILANNFMSICGDAYSRSLAPSNILINNGDLSIDSISNKQIKDSDFVLFTLKNIDTILEYSKDKYIEVPYNIYKTFDLNTVNIIASMKEDSAINEEFLREGSIELLYASEDEEYTFKEYNIYSDLKISTKYYFSIPQNNEEKIYHTPFSNKYKTPILIEEVVGKGFIIYVIESIINDPINYYKVIYELLIKVYLSSYMINKNQEDWIADIVPDYIIQNNKLIKKNKFTSNLKINEMFNMNKNDIILHNIEIDKEKYPFVSFEEVYDDYISFKKNIDGENIKYADPDKPKNSISIYTQNQNIIYFDDFIYLIDDDIEDHISIQKDNDVVNVRLKAYKHSTSGIYVKNDSEPIIINLIKVIDNKEEQIEDSNFYLVCKNNESASYFELIDSKIYNSNKDGDILLTIEIKQNSSKKIVYDMRKKGGGLPLTEKDNFDCFDIGHIYGRPYRKGNTLVITLPKRLEPYKDIIQNTIKQYSVAEEYSVIFFKED